MNSLTVKNISKKFNSTELVVKNASLEVKPGQIIALVGESGCGKSTLARIISGLEFATDGEIFLKDENLPVKEKRAKIFRKRIQMIFQNALGSFNPRKTIEDSLEQPFLEHGIHQSKKDLKQAIVDLLNLVGLEPDLQYRYPHQISGGQIQRAAIARAISCEPDLLIADEPTSALDVSIRAQILALFKQLTKQKNLSCLLITHDLSSLRNLADWIYVMKDGSIVEDGEAKQILNSPKDAYTKRLISAIPTLNPSDKTFEKFKSFMP